MHRTPISVFYLPLQITLYYIWFVSIPLAFVPHNFLLWWFCFILSCIHGISSHKIWDDHRPKSLKSKCIESWETTGRTKLWFTVAWFIEIVRWSPSSIRYFRSCLIHSAVPWAPGTWIQRTIVLPWQLADCQDGMEWHLGAGTCFLTSRQRQKKSENRPKEHPKSYQYKHILLVP